MLLHIFQLSLNCFYLLMPEISLSPKGGKSGELMCGQFTLWQISFSAEFNAYHRDHYNWPASFLLLMTIFVIMMIGCMLLIILAA